MYREIFKKSAEGMLIVENHYTIDISYFILKYNLF